MLIRSKTNNVFFFSAMIDRTASFKFHGFKPSRSNSGADCRTDSRADADRLHLRAHGGANFGPDAGAHAADRVADPPSQRGADKDSIE